MDRQIEQLRRCELISEAEVRELCNKAREILIEESNVQRVDAPVTVLITGYYFNQTYVINSFVVISMANTTI